MGLSLWDFSVLLLPPTTDFLISGDFSKTDLVNFPILCFFLVTTTAILVNFILKKYPLHSASILHLPFSSSHSIALWSGLTFLETLFGYDFNWYSQPSHSCFFPFLQYYLLVLQLFYTEVTLVLYFLLFVSTLPLSYAF